MKRAADAVAKQLIELNCFKSAQHIATYLAHRGELDPAPITHVIWQRNKQAYLPIVSQDKDDKVLNFIEFTVETTFTDNRFGIPEPLFSEATLAADQLDLVLVPLVAFDQQCNRIGMGGGFYDYTFRHIHTLNQRPTLIGLAYDFQIVDQIEVNGWDVRLDAVVTNEKVILA